MYNQEYEAYAVFEKETNERASQWYSRKHDALNRKSKWILVQDQYYVARVKFTIKEFDVIED